jgi:hypothetical protein
LIGLDWIGLKNITELASGSKAAIRVTFLGYLIKPIQRICKYPLLLRVRNQTEPKSKTEIQNGIELEWI